ncbi:hypothetical protein [Pseudonocardia alni]|uniref:hypothetical protein n=1 Tax=Pseudonocardia alni TaxID=33907 RepID=UPI003329489F
MTNAVPVVLSARLCAVADAELDNAIEVAIMGDDHARADLALAARESIGAQVPWVDGQWPAADQELRIGLDPSQWALVVEEVRGSRAGHERIGDRESVALGDEILDVLGRQLT